MLDLDFFKNKKILITGHTGFKGSWLCKILIDAGADVTGYALEPPTNPNLFDLCRLEEEMNSINGDIRDLSHLEKVFKETQPEIVIHMAAQPLVRDSYKNPVYTYETNVMGVVNVLECVRKTPPVRSFLNVTTDKVYLNREWEWGYRENEELNGYDPYSNSKSCSELVTNSYRNSFFQDSQTGISTARAGNVIGGGDFAEDRIIPDCIRAIQSDKEIIVRNPSSIRPYEHVLESLSAYLMIVKAQYEDKKYEGSYNVGPDEQNCLKTGDLVTLFCEKWDKYNNSETYWVSQCDNGPHEAGYLKLDCSKIKKNIGWYPTWDIETAVEKTVEWTEEFVKGNDVSNCMTKQISEFLNLQ